MSFLLFPSCDTRAGKYSLEARNQLGKLVSILAEGRGRGPMTIAQHSASALFSLFFAGVHRIPRLVLSCTFIPELCSEEDSVECLLQKGSTRLTIQPTFALVSSEHSGPVLPNSSRLPIV
jgi:hypothetical protein